MRKNIKGSRLLLKKDILLFLPSLICLISIVIYPLIYGFYLTFLNIETGSPNINFIGLENYKWMVKEPRFLSSLLKTLYFTASSLCLSLSFGLLLGVLLSSEVKGVEFFRIIMVIPFSVTPIVTGLAFKFLFNYDFGLINYFLSFLNLKTDFLGNPNLALPATILVDAWQWTPFVALIILAGMLSIPKTYIEAAKIDGASDWYIFRHITFPFLIPLIAVIIFIRFMDAFRAFDVIFMMTKGGPGVSTEVLSIYAWRYAFHFFNLSKGATIAFFMLFFIEVSCWFFFRFVMRVK